MCCNLCTVYDKKLCVMEKIFYAFINKMFSKEIYIIICRIFSLIEQSIYRHCVISGAAEEAELKIIEKMLYKIASLSPSTFRYDVVIKFQIVTSMYSTAVKHVC